jgi:hypothetical protein
MKRDLDFVREYNLINCVVDVCGQIYHQFGIVLVSVENQDESLNKNNTRGGRYTREPYIVIAQFIIRQCK